MTKTPQETAHNTRSKCRHLLFLFLFAITLSSAEPLYAQSLESEPYFDPNVSYPFADLGINSVSNRLSVDSLMNTLSLEQKIGQLFVVPAYGRFTSEDEDRFKNLMDLVKDHHIGGIIFMNGDIYGQATLTNKLQRITDLPLWITQDMEYGAAMRVNGTTRFTPAMGIAATGNPNNAYLVGKITAIEAKALGVNQVFAPVLDVNNNPDNPVINVRSFSADPNMVSTFGNAFIAGVESEGVVSTAKHFPGHGDTDIDSHLDLPIVNHDYDRLDSLEFIPFKSAIDKGLSSIMSAHIAYPNLSEETGLPATLDKTILNEILIDSLNFEGIIITDGLEMNGIASKYSPGSAVVQALEAGADIMLISPDVKTAIHEVEKAVEAGILTEERLDVSVRKILNLKKKHQLFDANDVKLEELPTLIDRVEYEAIAEKIARESVTLLKNRNNILPIQASKYPKIMVLAVSDDESGSTGTPLVRYVRDHHPDVKFRVFDKRSSAEEKGRILRDARNSDLVIIGSFIALRSQQPIQLEKKQLQLLWQIQNMKQPTVLVSFGNPYVLKDLKKSSVHVLSWSNHYTQIQQTVPALFGAADIQGKLPIDIPGLYKIGDGIQIKQSSIRSDRAESVGMSSDSLRRINYVMEKAIQDSVFPGGIVAVMKDGVITYQKGFGYHDYAKTKPVKFNDVYDVASITKVMATTTATMKLVDEGKLSLDDKLSKYIPEFDTDDKRDIAIRDVLLHQTGLPPFKVYVDKLKTRKEIIEAIKNEPLEYETGSKYVYSDLGMILLAEVISEVAGSRIDRYVRKEFYFPMGLYSSFYNPAAMGRWMVNRIPPTEIDEVYGRGLVQAKVHDERAYFMDGIAGHAGLFSSARDMAKYAFMLLNDGIYGGNQYLTKETIDLFTSKQSTFNDRGLGFDRKSSYGLSTAGQLASNDTFGHLGFTGTSLWIDREKNLTVIVLTNRTYPKRTFGKKISQIRAEIADLAQSAIIEYN